jgi:hypothetical protein
MTADQSISLSDLGDALDRLLRQLRQSEGDGVTLEPDLFWAISPAQLFDVNQQPSDLTIGQLSESWQWVRNSLGDELPIVPYALVWIGDILRAIGIQLSK